MTSQQVSSYWCKKHKKIIELDDVIIFENKAYGKCCLSEHADLNGLPKFWELLF